MSLLNIILINILWLAFAGVFLLGKAILAHLHFLSYIALRMLIAGAGYLLFIKVFKKSAWPQKDLIRRNKLMIASIVIFHMFLPFLLEYWGTQFLSGAKVSLIYSLSPLITLIISSLGGTEAFSLLKLSLSIFVCISPNLLLFSLKNLSAEGAVLAAVISSALAWVLIKKALNKGFSILFLNGFSMFVSGVAFLIATLVHHRMAFFSQIAQVPNAAWHYFFIIIFLSNFLGYHLYGHLIKRTAPSLISLSGILCPIYTAILEAAIFSDFSSLDTGFFFLVICYFFSILLIK